jgi:hypothetical protein
MRRPAVGALGSLIAGAAVVSCSLLVDTAGLSGTADRADADSDAPLQPVADGGDAKTDAAPAPDPCTDTTLAFCETFDGKGALARFGKDTDPTTSIAIDGPPFVTAPASARFEILPDTGNGSPDATLQFTTASSLARAAVDAWVLIERSEPMQAARLFYMSIANQEAVFIERDGTIHISAGEIGAVAAPPSGKWFKLHVELRTDVTPPTIVVELDGVRTKAISVGNVGWNPGSLFVRFGISEANSPTTGWLVHWDDLVVRSL